MTYTPTTWVEGVTKVGPTNLNHLEQGLAALANGGSLPFLTSAVTRDASSRLTGYTATATGVAYTITYDPSTGLAKTVSDGTTTRTISRDASGLVTGVA